MAKRQYKMVFATGELSNRGLQAQKTPSGQCGAASFLSSGKWLRWTATIVCLTVTTLVIDENLNAAEGLGELFATAQRELQVGEYDSAAGQFRELITDAAGKDELLVAASLGLSRSLAERGRYDEAIMVLERAAGLVRDAADVWAALAGLHLQIGDETKAKREVRRALDLDSQHLPALAVNARLLTEAGQIELATSEYRAFVRIYNRRQPTDWQTLLTIGEGAAVYARWESVSQVFRFVVNTLCPDALTDNPDCWQAYVLSGNLLLEKYNQGQALPEFHAALKINPQSADALVAMARAGLQDANFDLANEFADRALKVNPRHLPSLLVKAQIHIFAEDEDRANDWLQRAVESNPQHQEVLGFLAALEVLKTSAEITPESLDALLKSDSELSATGDDSKLIKIWKDLRARNPRPGSFLETAGSILESRRKYDHAEVFFRQAVELMPQLSGPQTSLGMLYMRTGRISEAEEILNAAFAADPFHVRVSNMRKVLGVLKSYDALASEHFVVRSAASEQLLAKVVSEYLEEIYPELTARYGYEPPVRSQFEIYSAAKDQPGHAWFSARMTGLPWFQTVGASTGKIVALTSPNESEQKFNWKRVIRHEFVHVLTLQKTNFNIPHWFTEAISVTEENVEMPVKWLVLLQQRHADNTLFDLSNINQGFQKPQGPDDWLLAYCQSALYAEFMLERFGEDALPKLLDAYQATNVTAEALKIAFGVSLTEFEQGYREFLEGQVRRIRLGKSPDRPGIKEAEQRVQAAPEDAAAQAELALLLVERLGFHEPVVAQVQAAFSLDPQQSLAAALMASYLLSVGKTSDALQILENASIASTQEPVFLKVQAQAFAADGRLEDAEEVLRLAIKRFPLETSFWRELLELFDNVGPEVDVAKVCEILEHLAAADYDDIPTRKRLARLKFAANHYHEAIRWAQEGIAVDVLDAQMHRILARSLSETSQTLQAIREYENLTLLDKMEQSDQLHFAQLLEQEQQFSRAVEVLQDLLDESPDNEEAQRLLQSLQRR